VPASAPHCSEVLPSAPEKHSTSSVEQSNQRNMPYNLGCKNQNKKNNIDFKLALCLRKTIFNLSKHNFLGIQSHNHLKTQNEHSIECKILTDVRTFEGIHLSLERRERSSTKQ
jgi:hypothetical protein